jgi:undecaprenyl-diphosphatase
VREVLGGLFRSGRGRTIAWNVLVAFLPSALIGLLLHDVITGELFDPLPVGLGLIAGGVLIFLVEGRQCSRRPRTA